MSAATHADVASLVADCAGQAWPSESIAPAGHGVLVSVTPGARIETTDEHGTHGDRGPRLRAWVQRGKDAWGRDHLVTRDQVPEADWAAALEEMVAQVRADQADAGPAVLAAARDAQAALVAAQQAERDARERRDAALAVALANGHTHETIAGWMSLTRGRVGQLATALRKSAPAASSEGWRPGLRRRFPTVVGVSPVRHWCACTPHPRGDGTTKGAPPPLATAVEGRKGRNARSAPAQP